MFAKPKKNGATTTSVEPNSINIIGAGTKIIGEINSNGDIRIDGFLKGNLTTQGKLVVGPTGTIIGDINCKNSDIEGKIEGKINVSEILGLKATANVQGDIVTNKLAVEPGAIFTGSCNMSGSERVEANEKRTLKTA